MTFLSLKRPWAYIAPIGLNLSAIWTAAAQPAVSPAREISTEVDSQASALRLSWTSDDPNCEQGPVQARIEQLVEPNRRRSIPLSATATVRHTADTWAVVLKTLSGSHSGTRAFEGGSCHEVQQAVALLLALTLDERLPPLSTPELVPVEPVAPAPAPQRPPTTPPLPRTIPPANAPESPPSSNHPRPFRLQLEGRSVLSLAPGLSLGAGLRGSYQWQAVEVGLAAGASWGEGDSALTGIRLGVRRVDAEVTLCSLPVFIGSWRLGLCGATGYYSNRAQTFTNGVSAAKESAPRWFARTGLRARYSWTRMFVSAEASVGYQSRQPVRVTCSNPDAPELRCGEFAHPGSQNPTGLMAGIGARF